MKPNNRGDAEGMTDAEILQFLAANPNAVRRPIIDTGDGLTLGFTAKVRESLKLK